MSDQQFQRAMRDWLEDGSDRTPRPAIDAVLLAVKTTPQERNLRIPRRFNQMPTYMRLAAGIAIVAVVGVGALALFGKGPSVGRPPASTASPASTSSPPPSPSPAPTPTPFVVPSPTPIAALTGTFVSTRNGIAVSYPTGWVPRPATGPWPKGESVTEESPFADIIGDGSTNDTAFLALASRPLGATPFDQWAAAYLEGECSQTAPITVDGAVGVVSTVANSACSVALVPAGGRVYLIWLYRIEDRSQFQQVLDTVDLRPEDAVDTAPSAAP
jgi:hypothetical protein